MQLATGKRPVGEEQTAKTVSLQQKLIQKLLSPWSPLSQWLDAVHGATVALGTRTRHMTAREWQNSFGDGILAGLHEGTVIFFDEKYTKEQVDYGVEINMAYHHNFVSGLKAGVVVVPELRPPLFKQGLTQQPQVDLTTTPNTTRERGTKRKNSEGNTNKRNQRSKENAMYCAIPDHQ